MTFQGESNERRRSYDSQIEHLHDCVENLKGEVARVAEITEQIRDILGTFRVTLSVAKWIAGIAAAVASVWAAMNQIRG